MEGKRGRDGNEREGVMGGKERDRWEGKRERAEEGE